jgi:hypothetical protein
MFYFKKFFLTLTQGIIYDRSVSKMLTLIFYIFIYPLEDAMSLLNVI